MERLGRRVEHLIRRAGLGAGPAEHSGFSGMTYREVVDLLVDYEWFPDTVDSFIGRPDYAAITVKTQFSPNTVINDARQRWLFRMIHAERPLQEKMALFWHNHFGVAYSKLAGAYGSTEGARMMAAKPEDDPGNVTGHIELLRRRGLGNFRDLLVAAAKDAAMLVWLDGRTNVKGKPQENFARELMELFTMGVGFYTEPDVYAGARVFTGWNLQRIGAASDPAGHYEFVYNASQHETTAKTFSFPIYTDGTRTIPARAASDGMQDGLDLIDAVVRHPETSRRLARKLYGFFVNETSEPDPLFIEELAGVFVQNQYEMKPLLRYLFTSPEFLDPASYYARYSWPVEFVVRSIKETGWTGFSVNDAITPLTNMGQMLFEPPDVAGWETGRGWFSTGTMLARMNFAATLAKNQKTILAASARDVAKAPQDVLGRVLDRFNAAPFELAEYNALLAYLQGSGAWTGSDAQLGVKVPGLVHLILGSAQYQFV
jgi:uncharacterized protein (DUF1800 family)